MSSEALFNEYPFLKSDRITLKKIEESDLNDLYEIYSNENLFQYRPGKAKKNITSVKNMIGHFTRDFNKKKMIFLGIFLNDENEKLIGVGEIFDLNRRVNSITIGYTLNEDYWGNGFATETSKIIIDFLFQHIKVNRIQAFVMPENVKSKNVLLRNNFKKEGVIRKGEYWTDKGIVDLEIYSILKEEYIIL
jgi:[ribosomal protein S5]-alanine N-acetyltransferase